ncbi:MAG: RcpC/CpaB family pilus assembly protein [Acidimicrobiales bacterium]
MKKSRSMLGVVAAASLALVGGLLLWQSSDSTPSEAAEEPVELAQVLIAARDIEPGTAASTMKDNAFAFIRLESIPADQALPDALTSVEDLAELALGRNVTSASITEGVQLTVRHFIVPGQQETSALPDVDENLFEVTVALAPQRALGGKVAVGQNVAVVGSFDAEGEEPSQTVVILESVLVTNVQSEQLFTEQQLANDPLAPSLAPTSRLFVTFGVPVGDLERLTYGSEFGRIWLARQGSAATIDGSEVQERASVAVSLNDDGPRPADSTPEPAATDSEEAETGEG